MEIIDNFLPEDQHQKFFNLIKSNYFPWFLCEVLNYTKTECDELDNYQFSYIFCSEKGGQFSSGRYFQAIFPFFEIIKPKKVFMIKANLTLRTNKIIEHGMHVDHHFKSKTAVYYVNTNDGYTKFETGEVVESVANRMVIFDSDTKHTGTTCTNALGRFVLNLNYWD
jgi:hypothetical protein